MMLYRLAELPRTTWRLPRPLAALPDQEGEGAVVQWGLRPALLDARERATLQRVTQVITAYESHVGHSRAAVRAGEQRLEELVGDYRLSRCLGRAVEESFYTFTAPPVTIACTPAELRARVYAQAQARHGGFVPMAARATFLAELAAEYACTSQEIEQTLQADAASHAVLAHQTSGDDGGRDPRDVVRRYNAAAVATVLAASAVIVLRLPLQDVTTLKDVYRRARGLRVGVDLTLSSAEHSADDSYVEAALYGPGSRALVRLREAHNDDDMGDDEDNGDEENSTLLPAAGGPAMAHVLAGLARNGTRLSGWARLLGPDRRLYHYPVEPAAMAALALQDDAQQATDPADATAATYDSAVEADFAAAFLAQQRGGAMGLTRGWTMHREPRPIIAGATVFLPDFAFRRGDMEVLCEIIGYYTDDYLSRKRRKLATLRGKITLLLVVDEELAAHFSGSGFPMVTYRSGHEIRVTDVVAALEQDFDPLTRRKGTGLAALRSLCEQQGPPIDEEALCTLLNCGGRTELSALWDEVTVTTQIQQRRYVAGQGLVSSAAIAVARTQLAAACADAGGCMGLDEAMTVCCEAGLPAPDDALMAMLGMEVHRQGLFGDAQVCLPGHTMPVTEPETPQPRRRRKS